MRGGPGTPRTAPSLSAAIGRRFSYFFAMALRTAPCNAAGLPALSLPCGFTPDGLPIGLHLTGRPFQEATVLRAAHAYERATPWHERRPESRT